MKFSRLLAPAILALLSLAQAAHAQQTAFGALFTANKNSPGAQLVEVTGQRGSPQPQEWKFFYLDPSARGGVTEITVANREIVSVRTPLRGFSDLGAQPPIPVASLKVDSDRAFQIANSEAVKQRVGFHWLDYTLVTGGGGSPRWNVQLLDSMGVTLGSMEISAETGAVVRPLSIDTISPTAGATPRPQIGGVIGDVRDLTIGIGTTVSNAVLRTIGTGQEILTGERTIGPRDEEESE